MTVLLVVWGIFIPSVIIGTITYFAHKHDFGDAVFATVCSAIVIAVIVGIGFSINDEVEKNNRLFDEMAKNYQLQNPTKAAWGHVTFDLEGKRCTAKFDHKQDVKLLIIDEDSIECFDQNSLKLPEG